MAKSIGDYEAEVIGCPCGDCGEILGAAGTADFGVPTAPFIDNYPHPQGWEVEGFAERQWLYITCEHCRYQNALWKLGVEGSLDSVHEKIARRIAEERRRESLVV